MGIPAGPPVAFDGLTTLFGFVALVLLGCLALLLWTLGEDYDTTHEIRIVPYRRVPDLTDARRGHRKRPDAA